MTNPVKISTEDDLFDIFDGNRNQPIKYFVIYNPGTQINPGKDMNLTQKMFRKFFYENSNFIDSETFFIEIQKAELAK